jgi:phage terminase large subunit-like protein
VKRDYIAIALQYAQDVVSGKILACKQVRQACKRHLTDLSRSLTGDGFEFRLDAGSATYWCELLEAFPHVKGRWAKEKQRFVLEPWQVFIEVSLFGWVEKADPSRYRFRKAYICIPRKNGKTFFSTCNGLGKFAADDEFAAEVYFGATSEEQARRLGFRVARAMAMNSPEFCRAFGVKINTHSLVKEADGSILKAVIARPGDGDSPSCFIGDEYHEYPTNELVDTMETGTDARENPLIILITTAGSNRSGPCYQLHLEVEKVLGGTIVNERLFGIIYTIDKGDDWTAEDALRKANPNYGVSVDPVALRDKQLSAVQSAHKQNAFKTKQLNIWVNSSVAWMNMEKWDECADPTLRIEDFEGDDCVDAFDLASRSDLADKISVFRRYQEDAAGRERAHYYVFNRAYQNRLKVSDPRNKHLADWELEGHLVVTPGNVTDYNFIADDLVDDATRFNILRVPHDPDHAAALIQFIEKRDDWNQEVEFVEITPNGHNFSPAMKETEALVLEGRLHHTGDPLLAWAISNVFAKDIGRGNIFPVKEDDENKIDPAIALFMAIGQWTLVGESSRPRLDLY